MICPRCEEQVDYVGEHYDARGIYIARCCDKCWEKVRKQYRQDVLEDPNYECDEPIEEEP